MTIIAVLAEACGGVAVYVAAGITIARRRLPVMWEAARKAWSFEDTVRTSVRTQVCCMVAAWPVLLPVSLLTAALRPRIDHMADEADPAEMARKVAARDSRIAELEQELGMRGDQ